MPPEDPGAAVGRKAGRFVRAAGLAGRAVARELEKGSSTPPSSEPPVQTAPQTETPAQPATSRTRRRTRGRRPEPGPNRVLDPAIYFLWIVTFNAVGFMLVQLDLFIPEGTARMSVDFSIAAIFLVMAWLLLIDPWQARQRLLIRIVRGKKQQHTPSGGGWRAWTWRLGRELLTLFGILCLAVGLWTAARGVM